MLFPLQVCCCDILVLCNSRGYGTPASDSYVAHQVKKLAVHLVIQSTHEGAEGQRCLVVAARPFEIAAAIGGRTSADPLAPA